MLNCSFVRSGFGALTGTLLATLLACGGGGTSPEDPSVLLQSHPVASNAGPITALAATAATKRTAAVRIPDATSLFNWAEGAYPSLFEAPQSNQMIDVWTYRYYPKTDIYLGVNTTGDVLGLVRTDGRAYTAVPLGKIESFGCSVYPGDCASLSLSITTQPTAAVVNAGQTASFSVVASGSGPLAYQWRRNGVDIAGATTASYTTGATTSADNGATFSVVVSNGTPPDATSNAAVLTVTTTSALLGAKNCMACHTATKKSVGPSWADVAARYAGQAGAEAYLAGRIRSGGSGVWGPIPAPNMASSVSEAEAAMIAQWLVSGGRP